MGMGIEPIQTEYAGRKFRSRTEARWAVFLNAFGEKWEYEVDGYDLPSGRYLPDFYLPRLNAWLEIKGPPPTEKELTKCGELRTATERAVLIAHGLPGDHPLSLFCWDMTDSSGGECEWEDEVELWATYRESLILLLHDSRHERELFASRDLTKHLPILRHVAGKVLHSSGVWLELSSLPAVYDNACQAASMARFEFGETPNL